MFNKQHVLLVLFVIVLWLITLAVFLLLRPRDKCHGHKDHDTRYLKFNILATPDEPVVIDFNNYFIFTDGTYSSDTFSGSVDLSVGNELAMLANRHGALSNTAMKTQAILVGGTGNRTIRLAIVKAPKCTAIYEVVHTFADITINDVAATLMCTIDRSSTRLRPGESFYYLMTFPDLMSGESVSFTHFSFSEDYKVA